MAACQHFDIKVDPDTKTPYKQFCTTEVSNGASVCIRHRKNTGGTRHRAYSRPQTASVLDDPAAKRFEHPE